MCLGHIPVFTKTVCHFGVELLVPDDNYFSSSCSTGVRVMVGNAVGWSIFPGFCKKIPLASVQGDGMC